MESIADLVAKLPVYEPEPAEENTEQDALARREHAVALQNRGIPTKDIQRILDEQLTESRALLAARKLVFGDALILVLSGPRGCGKTTAAAWAAAQSYSDPIDAIAPRVRVTSVSILSYEAPRFLDASKLSRLSRYSEAQMSELERSLCLAIDDLGVEYADEKGAFASLLDGVINARYAACLKTLITTNLGASAFKERYGERIADRIRECGRFVEINEPSMRGRK